MLRLVAGKDRIRFTDVTRSFWGLLSLIKAYLSKKFALLAKKYIPESMLRKAIALYVKATTPGAKKVIPPI